MMALLLNGCEIILFLMMKPFFNDVDMGKNKCAKPTSYMVGDGI